MAFNYIVDFVLDDGEFRCATPSLGMNWSSANSPGGGTSTCRPFVHETYHPTVARQFANPHSPRRADLSEYLHKHIADVSAEARIDLLLS